MTDETKGGASPHKGVHGKLWAGWGVFLLAVVGASQLGILLAKRISPDPVVESIFVVGEELDEKMLKSDSLNFFTTMQLLRDYEFREGVSPGSGLEAMKPGEHWVAPEEFLIKVIAEDGKSIQVEFIQPPELAGRKGWADSTGFQDKQDEKKAKTP